MADQNLPPTPERIQDLAASCVRFVEGAVGSTPDFTQDTLPLLDHYLTLIPEESAEEILGLVVPACGAYFGEVARRHLHDGRWHCPGDDYTEWRLEFDAGQLRFNPIAIAYEATMQDDASAWGSHFEMRAEDKQQAKVAIDAIGDVADDDYYRFGIRLEVLEVVYHSLLARERARKSNGSN